MTDVESEPIRLAMLGGGVGSLMGDIHRLAIDIAGGIDLVAGCFSNIDEENTATGELIGIDPDRVYVDEHALVAGEARRSDGVQAVSILTPNFLHVPQATVCLNAELHVICEKPLACSALGGNALLGVANATDRILAVTHTYTGYPMVRLAKRMVAGGDIGDVRVVQVEYAQGWLATALESSGHRQAEWRTNPNLAGAGAVVDIGTHAANLAEFVTGVTIDSVASDLTTAIPGRQVDDNVNAMLRFSNGAIGAIWVSQVAIGTGNDLKIRVFGSEGSLSWEFQQADRLKVVTIDGTSKTVIAEPSRMPQLGNDAELPAGNPRHYFEAFARLYQDAAEQIHAVSERRPVDPSASLLPMGDDGARAVSFADACMASSRFDSRWTPIS